MDNTTISQAEEHVILHISKSDLTYTIAELEKLHEEGGQFSLRLQEEEGAFILFQKVKMDKDNHTEVLYSGTVDGIWSSIIFFALCLFCFISVLYGFLYIFS
jgi:hypothetical protein